MQAAQNEMSTSI